MFCYIFFLSLVTSCGKSKEKESSSSVTQESALSQQDSIASEKVILCFGNSLTAGMGLNVEEAFPAVLQRKLDSLGLQYKVVNAGVSGETTAGGKNRIEWILNQKVDIFILELGANDGLRGISPTETKNNLQAIIDVVREKNVDTQIILAGMQMPPNLGEEYTTKFKNIFPELADENNVKLIPFILDKVAGIPELNQADGIHPTIEGQKTMAENVWEVLEGILIN